MPMEPGTSGVGVGGGQLTTFTTSTFTFHKILLLALLIQSTASSNDLILKMMQ